MSSSTSRNPLSAANLSTLIASSLPKDASPQLKSSTDAIAIACHAGMLAVGFRLVGLGEDHRIDASSTPENTQSLPAEWNANPSSHAFRYKHTQSSMEYLLKASRLGNKTVVYGIGMGDDKTTSFDITTKDFISESSLPSTPSSSSTAPEDAVHTIQSIFISPTRLADLGASLRLNIIQKLLPSLQKEGYQETSTTTTTTTLPRRPQHDPLRDDPTLPPPANPSNPTDPLTAPRRTPFPTSDFPPPGFDDEYEILRPARGLRAPGGMGMGIGGGYGDQDLYPQGLGPNDPLRMGGVGPGFRGSGGGGGMHPTFDDPLFGGRGGEEEGYGGLGGQAPLGARWDPLGPGGAPGRGFGGGGGRFGGGGMGGAPHNPFGGFGGGDFI